MGSMIEINDTLRINKEQGFPVDLDIETHLKRPYKLSDFEGKIFEFKDKPKVRMYQLPPVRNFLVEEVDGKWIYWGLCQVIELKYDMVNQVTSGKFKVIHLNSPEQMRQAFDLTDRRPEFNYCF